jgi:uncharacterized protein
MQGHPVHGVLPFTPSVPTSATGPGPALMSTRLPSIHQWTTGHGSERILLSFALVTDVAANLALNTRPGLSAWYKDETGRPARRPYARFSRYKAPGDRIMSLIEILERKGPRKLLAVDGGGIHGLISVEILASIEELLRAELGRDNRFVLADYFDYIAGASTGAIIAAALSIGLTVDQIQDFYTRHGRKMFRKAALYRRHLSKYRSAELKGALQGIFGAETDLGSPDLRTLLMIVLRNAPTDSPWPVSNNPAAKHNRPDLPDCSLKLPLWKLIRASTAAPTFFPPEVVTLEDRKFVFVDGGVSPYNNPAFQLFLMATLKAYRLNWPTGEDKMLLVSAGSGADSFADMNLRPSQLNLLYHAPRLPLVLLASANAQQDLLCRVFGRCVFGDPIDSEVGDLRGEEGDGAVEAKLFTYVRYNVELSRSGLNSIGLRDVRVEDVRPLDAVRHMDALRQIGEAAAGKVQKEHFAKFMN